MSDVYTQAVAAETQAPAEVKPEAVELIEGETPQVEAKPETPAQKLSRKLRLKIEGQEYDEELPFEFDENNKEQVDYLKRNLQMSKVASKRMNEAAITRKQAENFIQALQNDPMKVLSDPKIMGNEKFQQIAESYLAKKLEEQMYSPEQRKQIEMEQRLRDYESKEQTAKQEAEQKQIQQLEEHYANQYQQMIMTALNSSQLPKNPFTVKRMAELMQKNIQHGLELEPQHLAQLVREDYQKELVSLIGGADAESILSIFGDDLANKIRKHDLAKFKAGNQQPVYNKVSEPKTEAPKAKMRPDEYDAWLRKK